ncbi:hypothetical protein LJR225_004064 [Phenylobacterium sp. LjRoot225]|uniref:hypothetical protein n=1 Tax=Phenylobacterium sp. LjRoot225 TaxID=3342285 RepID=UPI003ED15E4C
MSARRTMGAMLAEVADGAMAAAATGGLRATRVEITLPVEVGFRRVDGETQLLADLPRLLTRTDFDLEPSRLTVVWQEAGP